MNPLVVGIGECQVTGNAKDVLITYALGSCIGIAIHDPVAGVGGLLHLMRPESTINPERAQQSPYVFADTGIPLLFRRAYECGAQKNRLTVSVAGGAQVLDEQAVFNIGKRNHAAVRNIRWKAGLLIKSEAVGGTAARTMRLDIGTGQVWLRTSGEADCEMTNTQLAVGQRI